MNDVPVFARCQGDSAEQIAMCLSCEAEECNGGCGRLAALRRAQKPARERKKPGRPQRRWEYRGEWLTMRQIAARTGLEFRLLQARLKHGWSVERAIGTPVRGGKYSFEGESLNFHQIAVRLGVTDSSLRWCSKKHGGDLDAAAAEIRGRRERA